MGSGCEMELYFAGLSFLRTAGPRGRKELELFCGRYTRRVAVLSFLAPLTNFMAVGALALPELGAKQGVGFLFDFSESIDACVNSFCAVMLGGVFSLSGDLIQAGDYIVLIRLKNMKDMFASTENFERGNQSFDVRATISQGPGLSSGKITTLAAWCSTLMAEFTVNVVT